MVAIQTRRVLTEPFPRWSVLAALASLLCAFAVVLSGQGSSILGPIEQGYGDLRTTLLSERIYTDYPEIVIVSVGDNVSATRATFERKPIDIDRGQLARLIEILDDSAPRAIGFDVPLAGAGDPATDQSLQRALREAKARVVIGIRDGQAQVNPERRAWLDRFIRGTGRAAGHITVIYDGSRATGIDSGVQAIGPVPDSFALLVARALRPEAQRIFGSIAWLQKVEESGFLSRLLNIGAQQPFRVLYAEDLLDASKPPSTRQLAGRLVLVTTGLAEIERHRTPLTIWSGEAAAPIQIQAQAIAQMLDGRSVAELEPRTIRLALFALACLAGLVGWYRGLGWNVFGTVLALATLIVIDAIAFSWYGVSLPLILAALVWLAAEIAGRCLRRVMDWEERHGHSWPPSEPEAPKSIARVV